MFRLRILFLITSLLSSNAHAAAVSVSGLHVGDALSKTDGVLETRLCRGVNPDIEISIIDLSSKDLERGVPCIAEDFDGNGSLDLLIYGAFSESEKLRPSLVIFFDGAAVIRTQSFPYSLALFKLSDPDRSRYPTKKKIVGLIRRPAQEGGVVYFFDKKLGKFVKDVYINDNGLPFGH